MCVQELAQRARMFVRVCAQVRVFVVQAMTWVNLLAMCLFLGNGASGVVVAILQVVGVYSKANAAGDEDSLDEAWVEGSGVPDAFHVSRPMKHWRRGYGFAFDVNHSEKKPYLVCFASGSAKRCALPDFLRASSLCRYQRMRFERVAVFFEAGGLRRYNANKLTRKFTIQTSETRAWAVPSVDTLPQVLKGVHVFHCWLGCAQVIEIHEVRGWLGQLTDRISRFHVRHIPTTARIGPYSSNLCAPC